MGEWVTRGMIARTDDMQCPCYATMPCHVGYLAIQLNKLVGQRKMTEAGRLRSRPKGSDDREI
jgi:hypothetical protein